MVSVVTMFRGVGAVSKIPSPSSRPTQWSGEKVNGAYLRVEICASKYNPNPLIFSHGKHLPIEERQHLSSCLTASVIKFREAVRPPFSKGDEHWGAIRRWRGEAPYYPVGRNALLMRSVKSAFALLLTKVTKPAAAAAKGIPIIRP